MFNKELSVNPLFMQRALELAALAANDDEVPVGALIVLERNELGELLENPQIISEARNNREAAKNPIGHAELLAIKSASEKLGRWRLQGCALYVTLEPCLMCAGAIILSRVDRVIYGARDPKAGAVDSLYKTLDDSRLNHRPVVISGVEEAQCSLILKEFFKAKRGQQSGF
jgi:tRNA(adenine34) deaminase